MPATKLHYKNLSGPRTVTKARAVWVDVFKSPEMEFSMRDIVDECVVHGTPRRMSVTYFKHVTEILTKMKLVEPVCAKTKTFRFVDGARANCDAEETI